MIEDLSIIPWGEGSSPAQNSEPEELPDNLRSEATVEILLLIGEGVIEGYAREPERSVFLDNTPVRRFKGTQYAIRRGLLNQNALRNYSLAASEQPVGVEVKFNQPVTRTIEDPNVDGVRLRFAASGLIKYEDDGDVKGSSFEFQVEVANNNGPFVRKRRKKIEGKASGQFQFDMRIRLDKGGHPWRIRVSRLTKQPESSRETNDFTWQAITELIFNRFTYPRSALFAMRFKAEYFNSLPSIGLLLKGLIIQVPSNYNPVSRTYTGIWDGTFQPAYSNNPAWCLYDLMTDRLYGAGEYLGADKIDKWSLYSIGQYCDERVPKPGGGTEPRFTFNAYIQNREDAYQVIGSLLSVFRGMLYEANAGFLYTVCNRPQQPVRIYSESNVIQETDEQGFVTKPPFVYSGTSPKVRHTVALVSYSDQTDRYRRKIAYVQDIPGIQRYGYRELEITAFGCTSRGQATRLGRWSLLSEQLETTTVTFSVGSDGMLVRPGEVIAIADPAVTGTRTGGRVQSYSPGVVTLDQQHAINPNSRLTLINSAGMAYEVPVLNGSGVTNQMVVNLLPDPPAPETPYIYLFDNQLEPQQFLVQSIKEADDKTYEIVAVEYNPSKFNAVDYDTPTQELPVSLIPNPLTPPPSPKELTVTESLYADSSSVKTRVSITWSQDYSFFPCTFQLRYRHVRGVPFFEAGFTGLSLWEQVINAIGVAEWKFVPPSTSTSVTIDNALDGYYWIEVTAVNTYGARSNTTMIFQYINGLLAPPSTPTNFRSRGASVDLLGLAWDSSPDLDVQLGGGFEIRWSPLPVNVWNNGQAIAYISGQHTTADVPLRAGTYMIKAYDSSGVRSIDAAFVAVDNTRITTTNFVFREEFDYLTGVATNLRILGNPDNSRSLTLADNGSFDSTLGLFDSRTGLFDAAGNTFDSLQANLSTYTGRFDQMITTRLQPEGTWLSVNVFDLGDVFNCRVESSLDSQSFVEQKNLTAFQGFFDSMPGTFDGRDVDFASAEVQLSTSANMTTWTPYERLDVKTVAARGFRFRVRIQTTNQTYNCRANRGVAVVDMPERVESGADATTTGGGQLVTFPNGGFYALPEFGLTINNMQTGDYYTVTALTTRTVIVTTFNSAGAFVARSFSWIARGFGRSVLNG